MTYRVEFHAKGDAELRGLPSKPFEVLVAALVEVKPDPWGRSQPDPFYGDPAFRWASFDHGLGVVHFFIDEPEEVLRVHGVTWLG